MRYFFPREGGVFMPETKPKQTYRGFFSRRGSFFGPPTVRKKNRRAGAYLSQEGVFSRLNRRKKLTESERFFFPTEGVFFILHV